MNHTTDPSTLDSQQELTADPGEPQTSIGASLQRLRQLAGADLDSIARSADLSATYLAAIESGELTPTRGTVSLITEQIIALLEAREGSHRYGHGGSLAYRPIQVTWQGCEPEELTELQGRALTEYAARSSVTVFELNEFEVDRILAAVEGLGGSAAVEQTS